MRYIFVILLLLLLCSCQTDSVGEDAYISFPETNPLSEVSTVETEDIRIDSTVEYMGALDGIKICIDPGHGIFDEGYKEPIAPGATETKAAFVSGTTGAYQTEEQFNLKLAYLLKPMLEAEGAAVYMTRTTEKAELSNVGRAEYANSLGCDMVVRIHADGSSDPTASGISVLIPGANQYFDDVGIIEASSEAGQYVLDSLVDITGSQNRGLIARNDLTGFNWTKVPCILVECGFMSNPEDDMRLADESYRILLAEGITNGLCEYYMTVQ